MKTILKPSYMAKFKCSAADCIDSCCYGWNIGFTKKEYEAYKDLGKGSVLKINEGGRTYANIVLREDGGCPLLSEDQLCSIQVQHGRDRLSNTCKSYPRNRSVIDGMEEESGTVSCPEIARLVLFDEEGIEFKSYLPSLKINPSFIVRTEDNKQNRPLKYFWEIRIMTLNILMNRDFSIEDRLIYLGIAYRGLERLNNSREIDKLPMEADKYSRVFYSEFFNEDIISGLGENAKIKDRERLAILVGDRLLKISGNLGKTAYNDLLKKAYAHFEGYEDKELIGLYKNFKKLHYDKYMKDKAYVMENFLVNQVFFEGLPFKNCKNIWEGYLLIVTYFSIVKFLLIGLGGYYGGLTDDIVLETVYLFSRVNLHNTEYSSLVRGFLKENKIDDLAYLALIIKN